MLKVNPALKHAEFCKYKISKLLLPLQQGAREGKLVFWSGDTIPKEQTQHFLGGVVVETCPEPSVGDRFALLFQWCQYLATRKFQLENKTLGLITRGIM